MRFLSAPAPDAITAISERLIQELQAGKRILWLVSGGSNVAVEVQVMQQVRQSCPDRLDGLAVMPMDERYGRPGHADSNVEALRRAGFETDGVHFIDILVHDVPFDQTVSFYADVAATALANAAVVVGQFGLGSDGHTAGILPGSPACTADAATVVGYEWEDYTRLTLSAEALRQIGVGYVVAYGADKQPALERLRHNDESFDQLPAKILYEIPEVTVYNDQIESEGKA